MRFPALISSTYWRSCLSCCEAFQDRRQVVLVFPPQTLNASIDIGRAGVWFQVAAQKLREIRLSVGPVMNALGQCLRLFWRPGSLSDQLLHLRQREVRQSHALGHIEGRYPVVFDQVTGMKSARQQEGQMLQFRLCLARVVYIAQNTEESGGAGEVDGADLVECYDNSFACLSGAGSDLR